MKRIAIFASGNGTNTENICSFFDKSNEISVVLVCSNKRKAGVLNRIKPYGIPFLVFSKKEMNNTCLLENALSDFSVDFIVLAGFLLKVPSKLVRLYENKIINLHPSLLPKYGGRGMYGDFVHKSVLNDNEKQSGITFHYVNNNYDEGNIIHQEVCDVEENETVKSLSEKISRLEQRFYPKIIKKVVLK